MQVMQTRTVSGARPIGASSSRVTLAAVKQVRASVKGAPKAASVPPLGTQAITPSFSRVKLALGGPGPSSHIAKGL